uniref:RING-type domain-containing protein n=1 Tax=Acrobeloides nanus TaxID=290746 RepID=A0A914CEW1_9BILA
MNSFYDVDVTKETLKLLSEMSELPNFKKLEKEEKRQFKWNAFKQKFESQHQEDKLKDEKKTLKKSYDEKIEKLVHNRKKKIEDLTKEQEKEVEKLAKKAKEEQEKELRKIYGRFQNEQKVLKDEVDKLPKSERKELLKTKKEELDKIQEHKEQELLRTLELNNEFVIATIREKFHTNLAMIDQDFFERKYLLIKAMNSALLELEEKQIVDKKIFAEQQIKKEFKLKQTQQEYRYEKENEHIRKENRLQEESLTNQLDQGRRELTNSLIKESNERIARFKELHQEETTENWLKSLDEYEEKERQIFQFSISDHESRCKMRLEEHRKKNMAMLRELEKIHIEKRQLLQNEELARLAQSEKEFQSNLLIYRANVPTRLQKMDEELNNL